MVACQRASLIDKKLFYRRTPQLESYVWNLIADCLRDQDCLGGVTKVLVFNFYSSHWNRYRSVHKNLREVLKLRWNKSATNNDTMRGLNAHIAPLKRRRDKALRQEENKN